jgi:hypothetical protein
MKIKSLITGLKKLVSKLFEAMGARLNDGTADGYDTWWLN